VWSDPHADWAAPDLVVVRSTWDYAWRHDAFVAWARSVPRILNRAEVIAWNTDKSYLAELPHAVATQFVHVADAWEPPAGEYVVKPTISSGSRDTARYRRDDERDARAHVQAIVGDGRTAMVQPYLEAVDAHGETALIYFGGDYSHAIRKGPLLRPGQAPSQALYLREELSPRMPSSAERAAAEDVLNALPWPRTELLYARVDLITAADGKPRLVELELTEPSLFFAYADGSAQRLAALIIDRLR
jgi:glutathione synthase/RimK-type ligase-like ATP-grasp enzyme